MRNCYNNDLLTHIPPPHAHPHMYTVDEENKDGVGKGWGGGGMWVIKTDEYDENKQICLPPHKE